MSSLRFVRAPLYRTASLSLPLTGCFLLSLFFVFAAAGGAPSLEPESRARHRPESTGDLDATDYVSLLQVGHRMPLAGENVPHASVHDIPEGPRAWALFQTVTQETGVHDLSNVTTAAPPGQKLGDVAPMAGDNQVDSYFSPANDENTPETMLHCLGQNYQPTAVTSWRVLKVLSPQLVPFVLPMDHPDRSDVAVILVPGGGGNYLAWEAEGTDVARSFNMLGVSAFVLKYRVPSPAMWPKKAHMEDAQRAVSLVKHFAPALGLNQSRVGMFGASHGGQVALLTAFAEARLYPRRDVVENQSPKPDFLLLNYPQIPLVAFNAKALLPSLPAQSDGVALGSLEHPPPIFMASGTEDLCIPLTMVYELHTLMKRFGDPPIEVNAFNGLGHGFSSCHRQNGGGLQAMRTEGCMWVFRARRFIMWNVEGKAPRDVEAWYSLVAPPETSLISTNSSGVHKTRRAR